VLSLVAEHGAEPAIEVGTRHEAAQGHIPPDPLTRRRRLGQWSLRGRSGGSMPLRLRRRRRGVVLHLDTGGWDHACGRAASHTASHRTEREVARARHQQSTSQDQANDEHGGVVVTQLKVGVGGRDARQPGRQGRQGHWARRRARRLWALRRRGWPRGRRIGRRGDVDACSVNPRRSQDGDAKLG
jgi:hypothetical protein